MARAPMRARDASDTVAEAYLGVEASDTEAEASLSARDASDTEAEASL